MTTTKTKTFLVGSLTINAITLGALIFLLKTLMILPNTSPPLVRFIFTNTPSAIVDAAGQGALRCLQPDAGFSTNSINANR